MLLKFITFPSTFPFPTFSASHFSDYTFPVRFRVQGVQVLVQVLNLVQVQVQVQLLGLILVGSDDDVSELSVVGLLQARGFLVFYSSVCVEREYKGDENGPVELRYP